jgi:predicted dehydrogenase
MPHETVKIGIIGAGLWGTNHALALATHPRCTVRLICDREEGRARSLAERFGCAWTTSLDQIASSDVDAVTIATPDHLHAAPTLAMLRAGKHVLVEKPLATSVGEALAMTEAAEASGLKLMVDFHARWHPLFMSAKGYVERGELGAPVMAYARLSDTIHVPTEMLTWGGRSGPEWFLFPHTMDVVRWLFGRNPVEVYAKGYRGVLESRGIECWDAIQTMIEFEGRAFCTFETCRLRHRRGIHGMVALQGGLSGRTLDCSRRHWTSSRPNCLGQRVDKSRMPDRCARGLATDEGSQGNCVTLTFASWNQIASFLRRIDRSRVAA